MQMVQCSSRNHPYPPCGRSLKIPRLGRGGGGGIKAKFFEAVAENKPEFPGGRGDRCKTRNLPLGEYGY